jgi:S-adenosylmethionine:tRNA ribosyltransferase-isomerase
MIIDRKTGNIKDKHFYNIADYLTSNDVLVLNKTKVFPARLFVQKVTGGSVELLFLDEVGPGVWKCLTKPGIKPGTILTFKGESFKGVEKDDQTMLIDTHLTREKLMDLLKVYGHTPIPPYIKSADPENELRLKYQTVYAGQIGSVAAPTAGFHFTKKLLAKLKAKGVQIEYVTLHVGMGTFAPVKTKTLEKHKIHEEEFFVGKKTFDRLIKAKKNGKRIISVGTTSTRVLETMTPKKLSGSTKIFIFPGYKFQFVDGLVTNFHLPKSTLLALVSAFVSYPNTDIKFKDFKTSLAGFAYQKAIADKYRFYSFGDACLII